MVGHPYVRQRVVSLTSHEPSDSVSRAMLQTIKSMGLYPCPRCLILKEDIPEVGSFLDMKHREKTARVYSVQNVEIARKAIFDSGRSVGYKGRYDTLKTGSWAPTRVCSFLVLAPPD